MHIYTYSKVFQCNLRAKVYRQTVRALDAKFLCAESMAVSILICVEILHYYFE